MLDDSRASLGLQIPTAEMDDDPAPGQPEHINDDLDDVFGSAPPSPTSINIRLAPSNSEPSDVPRLKEKHETEGYRDGVTKGKSESVQAGFDEGYALGAVLGLRIGKILGLLDGISGGLKNPGMEDERLRVEKLCGEAKQELSTQSVFSKEYWGEDGIWTFDVPAGEGGEVLFPDVAMAHPLVAKWEGVVEGEVRRWALDLGVLDGETDAVEEVGVSGKGAVGREKAREEVAGEPVAEGLAKQLGVSKKDLNW